MNADTDNILVRRDLGLADYNDTWQAMRRFTEQRQADTPDEIWLLQHPPVYTLGLNGKPEHILNPGDIPVVDTDRGGQVTYHGPGQLVIYLMIDARRRQLGVRELVSRMEQSVIDFLAGYGIDSVARQDAPGVYIEGKKIAALGLRFRKQGTYHGLSFNIDMDLAPFNGINPCGYRDIPVTRLKDHGIDMAIDAVADQLGAHLSRNLGYTMQNTPEE